MKEKKLPLHVKILLGMLAGVIYGLIAVYFNLTSFTTNWIKPFGSIFLNLLKMIAMPLVFVSLVTGVSSLRDTSKVKRIGLRTILIYISTTVLAVSLGLALVNVTQPGSSFPESKKEQLKAEFSKNDSSKKVNEAKGATESAPLQFLVDCFPVNVFKSASDNAQMLAIITFAVLFGVSMILVPEDKIANVRIFFEGFNEIILKMIDIIMSYAPIGVCALISSLLVEFSGGNVWNALELFRALGLYTLTVLLGLAMMVYIVYGTILKVFTSRNVMGFFKSILPVQMLAFSTSSSSATLPVTMEYCEKELGVSNEIASFVLPVGATVNMDGTSLYQSVATVFIAQALGIDLSFQQQLTIVLTATLASIGSAGVPGAGMVMLVIVLNSVNIPIEGIALIFAVDRILDMFRTTVNVTGDMVVAVIIQEMEDKRMKFSKE